MALPTASDNVFPKVIVSEGAAPATPASGQVKLYAKADGLLYSKDDAGTETLVSGGSGGLSDHNHTGGGDGGDLDAPVIDGYAIFNEEAAPSTPAGGTVAIYAKSDGRIYSMDDAGNEFGPFDAGGGAATPTLYIDTLGLTVLDDFADMSAWTTGGSPSAGSVITTEIYDADAIDLTFPSQSDRYYRAIDAGDWTYYLIIHGMNNSTPAPDVATAAMIAFVATDNSGNGTGMSVYNDGSAYLWAVAGNAYGSTGPAMTTAYGIGMATASDWPIIYRMAKVGTTITGGISTNGGATYKTNNRTDATTFTRIGITRLFTGGGTNPRVRVGRLYLVS